MPIEVRCGSCGATLRAPDHAGGKKVKDRAVSKEAEDAAKEIGKRKK